MLFNNSKYTRWYYNIIQKAQSRILTGYKERHHVIPRSLGGSNQSSNLADLTAKEHYIVHLLLPHMVCDPEHKKKMWGALRCMSKMIYKTHRRYVGSARFYEKAKTNIDFGHFRGRTHSIESRRKLSASLKGHATSEETRKKIGDSNRGKLRAPVSQETRIKMSQSRKGRQLSEDHKQKISEASKRRGHNGFKGKGSRGPRPIESTEKYQDTISNRSPDWKMKPRARVECPHCSKTGDITGMKRYHFDNCKFASHSLKI